MADDPDVQDAVRAAGFPEPRFTGYEVLKIRSAAEGAKAIERRIADEVWTKGKLDVIEATPGRPVQLGLAMLLPGQVVERPAAEGHSPMRHHTIGIGLERFAEALHSFIFVEAKAPIQPQIEPALRFGRSRRHRMMMGAEVVEEDRPRLKTGANNLVASANLERARNDTAQIATGRLATGAGSSGNRRMRSVPKSFGRARASLLAECSELTTGQIGRRRNCRSDAILEPAILSSPDL